MKKKVTKLRKNLQKAATFPLLLFVCIVIVAFVAFFGKKYTLGVSGSINCEKTGANSGSFPGSEGAFDTMQALGMKWYQGLINGPEGANAAITAINLAKDRGIKIILRICMVGECNFQAPDGAQSYIDTLKNISDAVGGTEFYAIAGHNEPNTNEPVDVNAEREFMRRVLDGGLPNNIKLLSPIMDLSNNVSYEPYLNDLGADQLARLDGIAANTYENAGANQSISLKVEELKTWLSNHSLRGKQIFITETGPWTNSDLASFTEGYKQITSDSQVAAALFFKPKGLHDPADHITLEEVCAIIQDCHNQNCENIESDGDGDFDLDDLADLESSVIRECAFEEAPLSACEIVGDLSMKRVLLLKYDSLVSSITPGDPTSCTHTNDKVGTIRIDLAMSISGNTALLTATFVNISNPGEVKALGHFQFAIRDANGGKIEGYEQGSWGVAWTGSTASWTKELSPALQNQSLKADLLADFVEGGLGCRVDATGSTALPTPPSDGDPNPTWIAEWAATSRIKRLPAFELLGDYIYSREDPGQGNTTGVGSMRLSEGKTWVPEIRQWLEYDTRKEVPGYGKLISNSGFSPKPEYDDGRTVLLAAKGPEESFTWEYGIPRQFFTEDKEDVTSDMEVESTHISTYLDNIEATLDRLVGYWNTIWAWLQGLGKGPPCKGEFYEIDELYPDHSSSGYESMFDRGQYVYNLEDIVHKSDLMETIEKDCEENDCGSGCKIATGLEECNPCTDILPGDPRYVPGRCNKDCLNIDCDTGEIKPDRREELSNCLKIRDIFVNHCTDGFDDFELPGAAYILKAYWQKLQMLSTRRICQVEDKDGKKNRGIQVDIEGKLYDLNLNTCTSGEGTEDCEPDPEFSCTDGVTSEMKAYFPYFGNLLISYAPYLALEQTAREEEISALQDCPNADEKGLCFCEDGQIDDLTKFLYLIGMLTTKEEIAMTGATRAELTAAIAGATVPGGGTAPGDGDDGDNDGEDGNGHSTPPDVPDQAKNVFELISEAILRETGQCIPWEMLAAVMSHETNLANVTVANLDNMYYEKNNDWCDRTNRACGSTNVADQLQSLTDRDINQIVTLITSLRNKINYPGCILPISQLNQSEYANCIKARTNNGKNTPIVCCDVRGKTQFEAATFIGHVNDIKRISPKILNANGFSVNEGSYIPERPRLVDSLVAAGLKLRHNGCEVWDPRIDEARARETVYLKAKEYNSGPEYRVLIWNTYKDYVLGT